MTSSPFNAGYSADSKKISLYIGIPEKYWTRTVMSETAVMFVDKDGSMQGSHPTNQWGYGLWPILYLIPGLSFSGSGTIDDPYIITSPPGTKSEKPVWVRTMPMTCWQIFINEDNMFEFIFWYPYKDNNWMQIFDMEGNMVYEVDVPLKDPHIIVDLPDGMYNVKTFRFDPEDPIQEFIIGKP